MIQRIGRRNVAKKVAGLSQVGTTTYRQGEATFYHAAGTLVVRPAFGIDHDAAYDHVETAPLLEALDRDYRVGALLVRLGGYAVGVFEGDRLVVSKVGQRLVHGRHKAGGSSANRFRRRRMEQARMLHESAAREAERVLLPHVDSLHAVALGGDRTAVKETFAVTPVLAPLERLAMPHFFTVADPRWDVLEALAYDLYAAEVEETL